MKKLIAVLILACLPAFADNPRAFDDQMQMAQQLLTRGATEEAIKAYKKAIKLNPSSGEAWWRLAQAYEKNDALKDGVSACEKGLTVATTDALKSVLHFQLAKMYEFMGKDKKEKLADAEREYRTALQLAPSLTAIHFTLGRVLLKMSRDDEGAAELRQYLAASRSDPRYVKDAERYLDNPRRTRENYLPAFSLVTADGQTITNDDLLGKIVVFDFWATWCGPCRASVPHLQDLVKRFSKDPVVVVSISADTEEEKWRQFIAKNNMNWAQYFDSDKRIQRAFGVHAFPTYLVADAEGIVRKAEIGGGSEPLSDVADAVKKNLKLLAHKAGAGAAK